MRPIKIYKSQGQAQTELQKHILFIPKSCPFHARMSSQSTCGSWCPHFFYNEIKKEVVITCSGQEVLVYMPVEKE